MAFVQTEPRYRAVLSRHGLRTARDFLNCPGVILSGHPRRHVLRVRVGVESYILKKEHHVSWRDRLASAWAGFGWSSKSVREARVLARLREAGLPCPEVVAAGEDGRQAFLLLREQAGMTDLREYLSCPHVRFEHQALAIDLGREIACIHAAGFKQPDLYAKHILVQKAPGVFRFCFLDWQRSCQRLSISWRQRVRDLAALDASLAEQLASDRLRLLCLRTYLSAVSGWHALSLRRAWLSERFATPPTPFEDSGRATHQGLIRRQTVRTIAFAIRRISERLLQRRRIRELRQQPPPGGTQDLLWLEDGERFCVARDFYEELGGRLPSWLPRRPQPCSDGGRLEHRLILLGAGRTARLVQRWRRDPAGWWRRGKFPAPEFAQASTIFQLQRFGVCGPRLLAMGFRRLGFSQRFSFLLTEPPLGIALTTFLRRENPAAVRHCVLGHFGAMLRQVHEAGYTFPASSDPLQAWVVIAGRAVLASVEMLMRTDAPCKRLAEADLPRVLAASSAKPQAPCLLSRCDRLRLLLGYLQSKRLDADSRAMLLRQAGKPDLLKSGERQVG
jgi:tRNA A-37 threonylcarbamoyl transferase component Bud32